MHPSVEYSRCFRKSWSLSPFARQSVHHLCTCPGGSDGYTMWWIQQTAVVGATGNDAANEYSSACGRGTQSTYTYAHNNNNTARGHRLLCPREIDISTSVGRVCGIEGGERRTSVAWSYLHRNGSDNHSISSYIMILFICCSSSRLFTISNIHILGSAINAHPPRTARRRFIQIISPSPRSHDCDNNNSHTEIWLCPAVFVSTINITLRM